MLVRCDLPLQGGIIGHQPELVHTRFIERHDLKGKSHIEHLELLAAGKGPWGLIPPLDHLSVFVGRNSTQLRDSIDGAYPVGQLGVEPQEFLIEG